jgi:hypothetical protein
MHRNRRYFNMGGMALLTALVWVAAAMGAARDAGEQKPPREVVLTQSTPQAVFSVDEQRVNQGQTTVVVRLVRQDNPDRADFSVSLMLTGCHGGEESKTVPIGALGTYPVAQNEGSYAFDIGPALKQMREAGFQLAQVCMKLELKPLRASVNWKRLRVTATGPEWQQPPAK